MFTGIIENKGRLESIEPQQETRLSIGMAARPTQPMAASTPSHVPVVNPDKPKGDRPPRLEEKSLPPV